MKSRKDLQNQDWIKFFVFQDYERLMITTWGHDPGIVPVSNVLLALNDALSHSAVLVQVRSHCKKIKRMQP